PAARGLDGQAGRPDHESRCAAALLEPREATKVPRRSDHDRRSAGRCEPGARRPDPLARDRVRALLPMKAAYFMKNGGPDVLLYGDVPDPAARPGEVLVDIHAASVNAADWKVRAGHYAPITDFPYVPGRDFSGVVRALGEGVKDFAVGDAVFGVCDVGRDGAYAEKIAIQSAIVATKPASLSHAECAALALTGLTALVAIEDTLRLKAGETILVQGGAGGVASFAI